MIEIATCHDFLRIFVNTEETKQARFKEHACRLASYRALKTGPNELQNLEPAYQTRLRVSPDACVTSVKSAPSPFMRNEEKFRKITEMPSELKNKGGAKS